MAQGMLMMGRVGRGVAAAIALVGLVFGTPFLLVVGGDLGGLVQLIAEPAGLLRRDDGSLMLGLMTAVGWMAWAVVAAGVGLEVAASAHGARRPGRMGGGPSDGESGAGPEDLELADAMAGRRRAHLLWWPRAVVRPLVAAIVGLIVTVVGVGPALAEPEPVEAAARSAARPDELGVDAEENTAGPGASPLAPGLLAPTAAAPRMYRVEPGDSLWSIAADQLGDGPLWPLIVDANQDLIAWADRIEVGWQLRIPEIEGAASGDYVVQPGDSLAAIAETLWGDASRWPELWEANRDRVADPHVIAPNWHLRVPGGDDHAPVGPAPESDLGSVPGSGPGPVPGSVPGPVPGSSAAESEGAMPKDSEADVDSAGAQVSAGMGDGEGAQVSAGAEDGAAGDSGDAQDTAEAVDADVPGSFETVSPVDAGPRVGDEAPLGHANGAATPVGSTAAQEALSPTAPADWGQASVPEAVPTADAPAGQTGPAGPAVEAAEDARPALVTGVLASAGVVLAGGLIAVLRRRRSERLGERPVGRRLRHPDPEVTRWETALGIVAADLPDAETLPVEHLAGARDTGQGRLIVMGDEGVDVTDRWGRRLDPVDRTAGEGPWALAGLGQDSAGQLLLMDLEQPDGLTVTGPVATERAAVVRAVALDLACRRWTDGVDVTVVADEPEPLFAGFDDVDVIEDKAVGLAQCLAVVAERRRHVDKRTLSERRADPDRSEAWRPQVFCFTADLAPDQASAVAAAVAGPSLGVTAVWTRAPEPEHDGEGSSVLALGSAGTAVLQPAGLTLRPPRLGPNGPIGELLAVTAAEPRDLAWWEDLDPLAADSPPVSGNSAATTDNGQDIGQDRGTRVEDGADRASTIAATTRGGTINHEGADVVRQAAGGGAGRGGLGLSHRAWPAGSPPEHVIEPIPATEFAAPTLLLLGPIALHQAAGPRPARAERSCLEYCGWLLEHPGATSLSMAQGLLVAEGTRRSNLSRLRTWLGQSPTGTLYLPDAYSGRLFLDPAVTSDWQRLRLLIADGLRRTPTDRLVAALRLVRGAPLADAAPGQWHWAEELRTDMVSVIRDVGVVVAERALAVGDLDLARWATARALTAVGRDERLLCARIQVEDRAGNRHEVERLVSIVTRQGRSLGVDLLPGTITLLQEVIEGRPRCEPDWLETEPLLQEA
jgi:LysM repeat protein